MTTIQFFLRHGMVRNAIEAGLESALLLATGPLTSFKYSNPEIELARAVLPASTSFQIENNIYKFTFPCNGQILFFELRRSQSDIAVFLQVMVQQQYKSVMQLIRTSPDNQPRIIDAGSNIGMSAMYFKSAIPAAELICMEPNEESMNATRNHLLLNNFTDIKMSGKALWTNVEILKPQPFRDNRSWSFSLSSGNKSSAVSYTGITLGEMLGDHGWNHVDLLKMDIEGAEGSLFRDSEFLKTISENVKLMAVEVHEEVLDRDEAMEILVHQNFRCFYQGELLMAINSQLH